MKKIISLVVLGITLMAFSTTIFASGIDEKPYEIKTVSIHNGICTLYGTLLMPVNAEKPPVVLFISGSGPTDRDGNRPFAQNNSIKFLAEGLAERGVASLRYDKRGIAESKSTQPEADLTFDDFIEDPMLWLKYLKEENKFSSVFVAGHSEGSLLGIVAAYRVGIDGCISLAGTGRRIDKVLLEQLSVYPEPFVNASKIILDSLLMGERVKNVPPMLNALFRPSIQPYFISWLKYDPAEEFGKLTIPTLVVQGTTDIQVPVKDAEILHEANPNSKLVIIEGMNHVLKEADAERNKNMETYTNPNLPVVEELVNAVASFIIEN